MIITKYSDLHLEFGTDFKPNPDADVMILAGDIITFKDFKPLSKFLEGFTKPVLYVAGNHEYYTDTNMEKCEYNFIKYITSYHPNVTFLQDEEITIDGVNFFGGTMWTNFDKGNPLAMSIAHSCMNDYRLIKNGKEHLIPDDTIGFHNNYTKKLVEWFKKPLEGKRVVISHHAPCTNPSGFYKGSNLQPAYNSLDMIPIIVEYKPELWFYAHTHEPDDQIIGETRVISNPRGYPRRDGSWECKGFDPKGMEITIL